VTSAEDIARWDAVAADYAGHGDDSFYRRFAPFLWEQLGPVRGRRILDLGCGHGWLTGELAAAGAEAVGVDGSAALIDFARQAHPGLAYGIGDLTLGLPAGSGRFDAVVSHMVLMDIPELERVVEDIAAALTAGGVFVFSILHPSFFSQDPARDPATGAWHRQVTGYLRHEERWITTFGGHTHYHRPLSWYVALLARHGLAVTALDEPPTLPRQPKPVAEWDEYERWFSTIPTMLAISGRRIGA
jgi:SAM-dependent methyltransferase